jgi:hypothetical protein
VLVSRLGRLCSHGHRQKQRQTVEQSQVHAHQILRDGS